MNLGGMASVAVNFKASLHVPSRSALPGPLFLTICRRGPGAQTERRVGARNRQGPVRLAVGHSAGADRDDSGSPGRLARTLHPVSQGSFVVLMHFGEHRNHYGRRRVTLPCHTVLAPERRQEWPL